MDDLIKSKFMIDIFFLKEYIYLTFIFYFIYFALYFITKYRINKIMKDRIRIAHVKWLLYFPLWFFFIFLLINLYYYDK